MSLARVVTAVAMGCREQEGRGRGGRPDEGVLVQPSTGPKGQRVPCRCWELG